MEEKYYSRMVKALLCLADLLLIYAAFYTLRKFGSFEELQPPYVNALFLIFSFSWITTGLLVRIYDISKYSLIRSISINLLSTVIIHFILMIIVIRNSEQYYVLSWSSIASLYIITSVLMAASRVSYKMILKYFEFSGFDIRRVVIVGATRSGKELYDFFRSHDSSGYIFKGFFDNYPNFDIVNRRLVKGTIDDLKEFCERENVDEIYFALPLTHKDLLARLTKFADDQCIYFRIAPDFSEVVRSSHYVYLYDSIPVVTPRKEPLGITVNAALKRVFDVGFSLCVITLLFPFIVPVIAIAIKIDSDGPVIFKQLRPGRKNKLFECYKFRTMKVNTNTEQMATKGDMRVTRVGKFLRKTSLDELPQFVNVLFGNMSVVGPRPNLISQLEEYSKTIKKYRMRHFVPPGITGYAQVNGCRGEIKNRESMEKRVELDVAYMENWSIQLDLQIILKTVTNILKGDKQAY